MVLTWLIKGVFFIIINLLSKKQEVILNRAKGYYENDKKKIKGASKR